MRGMGLLDAVTTFEQAKTRTQITGKLLERFGLLEEITSTLVSGYEIHMGTTENLGSCRSLIQLQDGRMDGFVNEQGTVFGTYLHGIFDTQEFLFAIVTHIARKSGVQLEKQQNSLEEYKEQQYDKLADLIRRSLDMEYIYSIMN